MHFFADSRQGLARVVHCINRAGRPVSPALEGERRLINREAAHVEALLSSAEASCLAADLSIEEALNLLPEAVSGLDEVPFPLLMVYQKLESARGFLKSVVPLFFLAVVLWMCLAITDDAFRAGRRGGRRGGRRIEFLIGEDC